MKMQIRDVSLHGRGAWQEKTKWAESLKKGKEKKSGLASRPLLVYNVYIVRSTIIETDLKNCGCIDTYCIFSICQSFTVQLLGIYK